MNITSISKLWSSGVRRYLKPVELLRGVVAGCRLAWNNLAGVDKLVSDNIPTGYGNLYATIVLPLSYIGKNRNVAGVGHIFAEEFPYIVVGAPTGIIQFSQSAVKTGAAKYHKFIEYKGVYYFKDDPTSYGIVNTKNGTTCTFLVTTSENKSLGYQDMDNKYSGSITASNNRIIYDYDVRSQATNGVSNRLYLLSSGVVVPETDTLISKQWIEGGVLYVATASGELLRDPYVAAKLSLDSKLTSGVPLTDGFSSQYALYPTSDGSVKLLDNSRARYSVDELPGISDCIPTLTSGVFLPFNTIKGLLEYHGIVTIDTTRGDSDVQRAVERRTNKVSTAYQSQLVELTYLYEPLLGFPDDTPTQAYLYFDGSNKFSAPSIIPGISAKEAILNNTPRYTVVRVSVQVLNSDKYAAISINGSVFGQPVKCGMYLKSVVLSKENGNNYALDTILQHINMSTPIRVNAGGCVVVRITKNSKNGSSI